MARKIAFTDPTTGHRKVASRATLATACRLAARKAHLEPSMTNRSRAQIWYRIGDRAGLTLAEMTDAVTGANGAV